MWEGEEGMRDVRRREEGERVGWEEERGRMRGGERRVREWGGRRGGER